jgi:hypothetical protein
VLFRKQLSRIDRVKPEDYRVIPNANLLFD